MFGGTLLGIVLLGTGLTACVGGSKGLSSEDKERLKPYILESAPADMGEKIDINFENKVHLVGFKATPQPAGPKTKVTITYYWRCDDTVEEGWRLFTHIEDDTPNKEKIGNLDATGPLREDRNGKQLLGPDKWEKGKFYVDEQEYEVPDNVKGASFTVYTGIWKGDARLRILQGPKDDENRAIAGHVKTGIVPPAAQPAHTVIEVPRLTVQKLAANEKITIDGKADEPAWGGAASTGPFVDVGTGEPNKSFPVNARARLLWDDTNLYAFFDVDATEMLLVSGDAKTNADDFTVTGQPKLWMKDTVEIMTDPDGDARYKPELPMDDQKKLISNYYELQLNPQGMVFHSQFDTLQQPGGGKNGPFGHEDWDPKLVSKSVMTKKDGKDTGYTIEVSIPWASFTKTQAAHPPKSGDTWRMNFYAMRKNGGVAWSPIKGEGNFHTAPRFGRVTWLGPTPPAAAVDAAAPAAANAGGDAGALAPPQIFRMPKGPGPIHKAP